jgi:uncharacterized protein YkwD
MLVRTAIRTKLGAALALLVSALLLTGVVTAGSEAGAEGLGRRRQMLGLTNQDRAHHDRKALDFAAKISQYAKEHSQEMAREGYLFHSSEDDLRRALEGSSWSLAGENVGVGSTLESLEDAFMASKLHRQNILRPTYQHAAVGIARADDRLWVTVIFYG